jgi:hypothetical protein
MNVDPIEVQKALKGISYPAGRDEIVEMAEQNEASEEVIESLQSLADQQYDGPDEVEEALA